MTDKQIKIIRWLMLVPVTILATLLAVGIVYFMVQDILENGHFNEKLYRYMFSLLASVGAVVWLLVSYIIAPSHKKRILWLSFFAGSLLVTILFYTGFGVKDFISSIPILIVIFCGLVVALLLQADKGILNEIERSK